MKIANLKPGKTIWDKEIKGLHARALTYGKAFYLSYRTLDKKQCKKKIGDCNVLTLAQARSIAKKILAENLLGVVAPPPSPKLKEVFLLCTKEHWAKEKYVQSGWSKEVEGLYRREIAPTFGELKLQDITAHQIEIWHNDLSPVTGNRAKAVLSKLFLFAQKKRFIPQGINPCSLVSGHKEKSRQRYATKEEIFAIGKLLESERSEHSMAVAFLYLLIFTGSRPSAIERARWDELSLTQSGVGLLRFEGKTGPETVVIPAQAMEVINTIPRKNEFIFGGMKMPRRLWSKIRKEAGCEDLWARDWRRTFSTIGLSSGHSIDLLAKSLNHSPQTAMEVYAKVSEEAQVKTVTSVADEMEKLLKG